MIMIKAAREITDDLEKSKTKGCNQAAIIADDVRKYTDSTEEYLEEEEISISRDGWIE
jgi:hypothetical protein